MPLSVVYFHRKNPHKFISIEAYFENVRKHLPAEIKPVVAESKYYSQGFFKRLYNMLEAMFRQGDVNHITGDVHFLTILLSKKKTILTIHDLVFLQHPSALARKVMKMFWLTLPVQRSALITAVSEATKREIIKETGCRPDKITVIPTCIGEHFKKVEKPFYAAKPVLLQIGTAGNKNCINMAKALEGLPCKLEIIGFPSPEYIETLKALKIEYTASSHLTDEAMLQKYIDCDILLFASTYEGFGMPIIEANTVGRVVITSNISSMPEVAGNAACQVDPYEVTSIRHGIDKVINEEEYRNQKIIAGFENAKRFRLETVAGLYYQLYKKAMSAA